LPQPNRLADAPTLASALRWANARVDDAAQGFAALGERLRPRASAEFVEQPDGSFAGPAGALRLEDGGFAFLGPPPRLREADVEFRLTSARCMFRELELPAGAGEFLDGVVRAQLDRLTPWRANEAAFGWSAAGANAAGMIRVTVAATKRQPLAALLDFPAHSVVVTTMREAGAAPIAILSRRAGASSRQARWRVAVLAALGVALVSAASAAVAEWTLGAELQDRTDALTADLAQRRAALLRRERAEDDQATQALEARKRATPATVVALEALSRAIPDDAYLTQMRVAGDRIEFSGIGADAAGLIKLIERSPHFSHAAFTAPTTRGADDRESFRIQAHLAPLNTAGP
jgi:general secretion pathway protein L